MTERSAASFRDRHSGISLDGDKVIRTFSKEGAEWFREAQASGLLDALIANGWVIEYEVVSDDPLVIASPRIPIVSYPYEWTASMLRDAALRTLDIATKAWDEGFHLRDASAFNIVFRDGQPVMVDLGSFRPGHTPYFLAYGQFCDHFLNPLVLAERTGVSSRAGWESLEGLSAPNLRRLVGRRLFRPRFLRHVWARASLEDQSASMESGDRKALREQYGLPPDAIRRSMTKLSELVSGLESDISGVWDTYEETKTYATAENEAKRDFVRAAASRHSGAKAVDIGANTGAFSEILAEYFDVVVAVEPDEAAAEIMYRRITSGDLWAKVTPVVADVVDPPPGRGFANSERSSLLERLQGADLMVWLAVFHHLVISRNVPLPMLFDLAADLAEHHVIEHVAPDDEMVQLLLSSRDEIPWPLDEETFVGAGSERFEVLSSRSVSPTRTIYELRRR